MQIALPIPEPQGWLSTDNYKIQFAYDGEPFACTTFGLVIPACFPYFLQ